MVRITGEVTISRPVEEVFDVVADERNEPRYNPALLRSDLVTGGPLGVGTKFASLHKARRGPFVMNVEVTEFDRPRRLGSRTTTSAGEVEGHLTFAPVEAGTRLRWSWDVRPAGVARLLGPLIGIVGRRQERACWDGLKQYLEAVPAGGRG